MTAPGGEAHQRIGRYRIADEIGAGGMATVHLGAFEMETGLVKIVAVKRLLPHLARERDVADAFMDEARMASRVTSPNVVQVLDAAIDGSDVIIVMEYVDGLPLDVVLERLRARGERVPPPIASAIASGILEGLAAAHAASDAKGESLGLVHRDVSPHNVMIAADGTVKVLDFGIARAEGRSQVTRDGSVKGKPRYLAPEVLEGEPATPASDVYATGIVLWEMLTGEIAFYAADALGVRRRVLDHDLEPVMAAAPDVPRALGAVVLSATASSAELRPEGARVMQERLVDANVPAPAREVAAWIQAVAGDELEQRRARVRELESALDRARRTVPRVAGKKLLLVMALVILAVASALAWAGAGSHVDDEGAPSGVALSSTIANRLSTPAPTGTAPDASLRSAAEPLDAAVDASEGAERPSPKRPSVRAPQPDPKRDACDPPYVLDANGHKRFRRECLP